MSKTRVIALVDCDCFFVSCERLDNPHLNNKPVVVVTSSDNRGIVVSRSSEAKKAGIKMGQPVFQFRADHPDVICIPSRLKRYDEISQQVMKILFDFTPDVEVVSIDEAYLDITGCDKLNKSTYTDYIRQIRTTVLNRIGIPVSIGLGTSKTLAKLASDKAKQSGGICVIPPHHIREKIINVPLNEICGIGKQSLKQFHKKDIWNMSDLLEKTPVWMKQAFGVHGERLRLELSGVCVSKVNPKEELPQSVQDTKSLEHFTTDFNVLKATLPRHVHHTSQKLRLKNGFCQSISVLVRTKDFTVREAEEKLNIPTNSEKTLLHHATCLLQKLYRPDTLYRSVGVTLKNLTFGDVVQHSLFQETEREDDQLSHLMDALEKKFGKPVLQLGLPKKGIHDV